MLKDKINNWFNKIKLTISNDEDIQESKMDIQKIMNDKAQLKMYNTFKYKDTDGKEFDINVYIQDNGYTENIKQQIWSIIKDGFDKNVDYRNIFSVVSLIANKDTIVRLIARPGNVVDILVSKSYREY